MPDDPATRCRAPEPREKTRSGRSRKRLWGRKLTDMRPTRLAAPPGASERGTGSDRCGSLQGECPGRNQDSDRAAGDFHRQIPTRTAPASANSGSGDGPKGKRSA